MTRSGRRAAVLGVLVLGVAGLTAACGGSHDVTLPGTIALDSSQQHSCDTFVAALPATLAQQKARAVASGARGRAYGDPAITVACGVKVPSGYSPGASCEIVDGVDWYAPDQTYTDQHVDAVITAVGYTPAVQVVVPAQYRPEGVFLALDELSRTVKQHLQAGTRCS